MADEQQRLHKIPASITLAQGLLESGAGRSTLAREANNHFGIKCHGWTGKTVRHDDDLKDECFRKYNNPRESFEDHSEFLKRDLYKSLFELKITDYRGWAKGLKACGYATDKSYANKLIQIIETYELYQYDKVDGLVIDKRISTRPIRVKDLHDLAMENPHATYISRGLLYIEVREGDCLEMIAAEFNLSPKKLAKYNDIPTDYPLAVGDILYVEKKYKKIKEGEVCCVVGPSDSMHALSQRYGIQLKSLYKLNDLPEDYYPEVGAVLRLR